MRFHLGSFPKSADFIPDSSWKPLEGEELSNWILQLKLLPVAIVNMAFIMLIWIILTPVEEIIRNITFPLPITGFLICLMGVLIIHELIHTAVHPMAGFSSRSIIGFWPSKMLLYATYDGELNRNRFITIFIMPFIVISIIPIFISSATQFLNVWLVYITILNAFLSMGDVLAVITIFKFPPNVSIRSHGDKAYWRENVVSD
jgi:hypothetical protein